MPKTSGPVYHFGFRWSILHNDINSSKLRTMLRKSSKIDKWIFQAEDTVDNPHYQGYFHTKDKIRPKQLAINLNGDFLGIEIQAASTNGKSALQDYAMKDETRVAGPWADHAIYMGSDLWPEHMLPEWQKSVNQYIDKPPGDRKMLWIYDPVGNNGKTKFVKTTVFRKNGVGLGYGQSTDVLNLVSKLPDKNVYIWNLTRAKPANLSELDLYSAMESVKDGYFINLKYETKMVLMNCPHVIVMANHLPKTSHISIDRWSIFKIEDSKLVGPILPFQG